MRCRNCDYPLWNLKTRNCPECGVTFQPSEFEFHHNSVRFCCQHCEQPYYGTGQKGHLYPREFQCVSCKQQIHMDEMVLRPAHGVAEAHTVVDPLPWLRRRSAGWFKSWWYTTWRGMIGPNRLAQGMPAQAAAGDAWWYAFITFVMISFTGFTIPFGGFAILAASSGDPDAIGMGIAALCAPIVLAVGNLIGIGIWGAVTHATLRLTGGCSRTIGSTYQALCYTAGANILVAVPCIGMYCLQYVSGIWWIVSAIIMLAAVQRVHGGRATLATLVLPVVSTVLVVGLYFWFFFWAMSVGMAAASVQAQQFTPQGETQRMTDALRTWATDHNGNLPGHALALYQDGNVSEDDFISVDSITITEDVPLGDVDLDTFAFSSPAEQSKVIDAMLAAQPDDVIAHRVGDFVFTYHGIDPETANPNLWLVVLIHDPDRDTDFYAQTVYYAGTASGFMHQFNADQLQSRIAIQNDYRADAGLPPLPDDLDSITHDTPAVR